MRKIFKNVPANLVDFDASRLGGIVRHMGPSRVFAKNLRLLTSIRGLKATTACLAIQEMLEQQATDKMRTARGRNKDDVNVALASICQSALKTSHLSAH